MNERVITVLALLFMLTGCGNDPGHIDNDPGYVDMRLVAPFSQLLSEVARHTDAGDYDEATGVLEIADAHELARQQLALKPLYVEVDADGRLFPGLDDEFSSQLSSDDIVVMPGTTDTYGFDISYDTVSRWESTTQYFSESFNKYVYDTISAEREGD